MWGLGRGRPARLGEDAHEASGSAEDVVDGRLGLGREGGGGAGGQGALERSHEPGVSAAELGADRARRVGLQGRTLRPRSGGFDLGRRRERYGQKQREGGSRVSLGIGAEKHRH